MNINLICQNKWNCDRKGKEKGKPKYNLKKNALPRSDNFY